MIGRYGKNGLVDRAMKLIFSKPADRDLPEGVFIVAMGLVFHLGTPELLVRLIRRREEWAARVRAWRPAWPPPVAEADWCWHGDALIAAMCRRMAVSLPEGVRPLDPQEESMLFQTVQEVTLIRHAYVRTRHRRRGIGSQLLQFLLARVWTPTVVGTWAVADWAIRATRSTVSGS
jgi:GNAT superfamily N-acetyltransferase